MGRLAILLTTASFVLTGDLPWLVMLSLLGDLHLSTAKLSGPLLTALQVFPTPLILLATSLFYLWAYARRCFAQARPKTAAERYWGAKLQDSQA